jgi:hypothetical protein
MIPDLLRDDVQHGILPLVPRTERRGRPRVGRVQMRDTEPVFVTWEPPVYVLEVVQARNRLVLRVARALTVAMSFGVAWYAGLAIGRF